MHHMRSLVVVMPFLLVGDAAIAASKHEQTRRAAGKKRDEGRSSGGRHHHSHGDGDSSDFWGSCLGGCLSEGCSLAIQGAVESTEMAARASAEPIPPAPGFEQEGPPDHLPGDVPADLGFSEGAPEALVAGEDRAIGDDTAAGAETAIGNSPRKPWRPEYAADGFDEEGAELTDATGDGDVPAAERAPVVRAPVIAPGTELPGAPGADGEVLEFLPPEAYGVAAPGEAPPRPPPPPGWNGRFDLRTTGAWIFGDLPNASFDARMSVGSKGPGPAFQLWYTGLWERIEGSWDHLPVGGARLAFAFGPKAIRFELRFGGALLGLREENLYAFESGLALEIHTGGADSPWIDLQADLLIFDDLTATDLACGVSFPAGPFYVRVGFRSLYLEPYYAGPEVGLGVRL